MYTNWTSCVLLLLLIWSLLLLFLCLVFTTKNLRRYNSNIELDIEFNRYKNVQEFQYCFWPMLVKTYKYLVQKKIIPTSWMSLNLHPLNKLCIIIIMIVIISFVPYVFNIKNVCCYNFNICAALYVLFTFSPFSGSISFPSQN